MNIIIDAVIVLTVAVFAVVSYKRGFLATAVEHVGFAVAFFASLKIAEIISSWIYSAFIRNSMITKISAAVNEKSADLHSAVVNVLPKYVGRCASAVGIDVDGIIGNAPVGEGADAVATQISDKIICPVVTLLIRFICVIVLFIVFSILIKLLVKMLKLVNKIPLVGTLNKLTGALLGIVKGFIIVALVCFLIDSLVYLRGGKFLFFNKETIESTHIFEFLHEINPIS